MRIELISQAIYGADVIHPPRTADLPPQILDVLIYKVEIRQVVGIVAPQMRRYRLPRQDPVLVDQEIQKEYFANFRQRVANTMIEASIRRQPLNNIQAEEIVWQKLEEELLQVATGKQGLETVQS